MLRNSGEMAHLRKVAWIIAATFVIQVIVSVASQTYLYGDGGNYLYRLMATSRPMSWDFSRRFAHLITQLPAVVGIRAGVTSVDVLSRILGIGLYLPHVTGLLTCLWIARRRAEYMLFPLLSAFAITSNTDLFIISESNQLVALFWPLVFMLSLWKNWTTRDFLVAAAFVFPTLRCYESMLLLGPILLGLAVLRALEAGRSGNTARRNGFLAFALYFGIGIAIALWWTLHPRNPTNFQSFIKATLSLVSDSGQWHLIGMLSIVGTALAVSAFFIDRPFGRIGIPVLALFAFACAMCALSPWLWPTSVIPDLHARWRTLNAYAPPVLATIFLLARRRSPSLGQLRYAYGVLALLSAAQLAWHVQVSRDWVAYLEIFRGEVSTREGLVPFQSSALALDLGNGRPIAAMNTTWTMPVMSILLSPGGQVRAMMHDPYEKGWQPFDPAHPELLPDLSRYGIRFDAYQAALARSAPER